jgi:hypothetical protein
LNLKRNAIYNLKFGQQLKIKGGETSMAVQKNEGWALFFVGLGYLGAAVFYSYLVGINANIQVCLVCPHITSSGPAIPKFVFRALLLGTPNALFLLLIGWSIILFVRFIGRISFK